MTDRDTVSAPPDFPAGGFDDDKSDYKTAFGRLQKQGSPVQGELAAIAA